MSELRTNRIVPRDGLTSGAYGGIIQVKYASASTYQSYSSTDYGDVTGASVSITPTRSDSAIILLLTTSMNQNASSTRVRYRVQRDIGGGGYSTLFTIHEALVDYEGQNIHVQGVGNNFIDTPSTTSAVTYKLQVASSSGNEIQINNNGRTDMILMEIAG